MLKNSITNKLVVLIAVICSPLVIWFSACSEQVPVSPQPQITSTSKEASGPKYGGILKVADSNEGVNIGYPPKMTPAWGPRQIAPALETLFRYDAASKVTPWLATDEVSDATNKTITLTLRKGVKFHDGTDFNASAVKWNLDQQMAEKNIAALKFKSVDIVDDYTVRINLTDWDNGVLSNLCDRFGMIISPTAYNKNGKEWIASNPVGTGPFQFVSCQKQVKTVFKKFDDYWQKGKPYLDGIEIHVIADATTRQMAFKAKEIDLAQQMPAKDGLVLKGEGYNILQVLRGSGAFGLIPDSANQKSPFANVKVRQAVSYAVDSAAIAKSIFFGLSEGTNQYNYKSHWGYNNAVIGYPYDTKKAKQLLAEAGFPNGFKTKITYLADPAFETAYISAQAYLREIGIDVELDASLPGRIDQMIGQGGLKSTGWDGMVYCTGTVFPDVTTVINRFFSGNMYSSMLLPENTLQAIKNMISAKDFTTKQKWAQEWQRLVVDEHCLIIPLFCFVEVGVEQPYVNGHGIYGTANTQQWTPEGAWLNK